MSVGLLSALLCCSAATLLWLRWQRRRKIRRKIEEAQQKRERALERMGAAARRFTEQNPSHRPESILSLSLPELCRKLRDGLLLPESVLYTYMDKALKVTKDVNCLTDYLEDSESQLLQVKSQGNKGLLYGVPVSIKDSIDCKGFDSTLGFVKRLNHPAAEDAVLVQVLKHQGAIPFVKTNVPQSLMNFDCSNLIFGQTVHPLDHTKTPGGSSGGEASLIKSGGSILGIGTDIGGSIRIPSGFCGICGLKTTGDRISKRGVIRSLGGQKSVVAGVGPMARDVESLAICLRSLLCEEMFRLDPKVPPLPFNEQVYSSSHPLRIGYYVTDSFLMPTPSMKRAILETKELLEKAGHVLVPFKLINMDYFVYNLCIGGTFADGSATYLEHFKGELVDPSIKDLLLLAKVPNWMRRLLSWIVRPISPRASKLVKNMTERSVKELWELHFEIEEYCYKFIAEWKKLQLDVMLCPALSPAYKIGYPGKISMGAIYTMLYNYLDFPAGVVPVTTVTKEDEEELKNFRGYYNDIWDKIFAKAVEGGVGLPVTVQCVALPWQEELCLRFMKEIETLTSEKRRTH
ncbi:fatty-acid amide hydrolase 1 [Anolis carolinensis]|uniref:Fatty-acid amide hydrolase 1 n=1 Tax=Anolis carolinensis TaxID=28377 RepID=G1KA95_ANOCA|nr:PREDICTED: fatty-acid amide hydrolase 1 [Anolis carolinensis]|eukprot:XP_008107758.1 PREDICTED: fatty-acid amide hydrolase 1 [Anolis carolinensis]